MKKIGTVNIDYSMKVNLAGLAKKYEGKNAYLALRTEWGSTHIAVFEYGEDEKVMTEDKSFDFYKEAQETSDLIEQLENSRSKSK